MAENVAISRRHSNEPGSTEPVPESQTQNVVKQRKRRADKQMEWAKIRPIFQHLYIDLDMTLRDVIQRIDQDHDFRATEHMYKKRINAWGLSKHVKADEKETALAKLLHNDDESPTSSGASASSPVPIRHDKLIRYAKSRAKSGALDARYLNTILNQSEAQGHGVSLHKQRRIQSHSIRRGSQPVKRSQLTRPTRTRSPTPVPPLLPRSPTPPPEHAKFDLFLRAMTRLINRERQEWLRNINTGVQHHPSLIFDTITTGFSQWRANETTSALQSFNRAAQTMTADLRGNVNISRIVYCISSLVWGQIRSPVFLSFVVFMRNSAHEILGATSPLTIVLDQLSNMWSLDAQVQIWACAVENYVVDMENLQHWWNMVRRRWCWCRESELMRLAVRYRGEAVEEARKMGMLTEVMEKDARQDLESIDPERNFKKSDLFL